MRRLLMRIGYRWLAVFPAIAFFMICGVWFALGPFLDRLHLLVIRPISVAITTMIAAVLFIVSLLAGPLHEHLLATVTANVAAPWSLVKAFGDSELPSLSGWSLVPQAAAALVRTAVFKQLRLVVELGLGASTELVLKFLPSDGSVVSLEHDEAWRKLVLNRQSAQERERFEIRLAPLVPTRLDGWKGHWYDQAALGDLKGIDLLVVDGPPGAGNAMARYPAVPVMAESLADRALIFVDDTDRPEESRIVQRWLERPEVSLADRGANCTLLHWHRSVAA